MKRLMAVLSLSILVATTSAYAAFDAEAKREARTAAIPQWMHGFWDDTSSKRLAMEVLKPGHTFCTHRVKTQGPCARTPLAGHVIGAALSYRDGRLSVPERYRSGGVGTCASYVPIYRVSKSASPPLLTLIGYRDPTGRPVRAAAVQAVDCVPPNRWHKRADASRALSSTYVADRLYGKYRITLGPKADPEVPAGTWTLTLAPGKYSLIVSSNPIDNRGALRVIGDTVVFSKERLCAEAVGRYRWHLRGRKLRLTLIGNDTCSGNDRIVVMTTKTWTRVGS